MVYMYTLIQHHVYMYTILFNTLDECITFINNVLQLYSVVSVE